MANPSMAADAQRNMPPKCSYPSDVDRDRGGALDEAPIMQQALRRSKTTIEWHEGARINEHRGSVSTIDKEAEVTYATGRAA